MCVSQNTDSQTDPDWPIGVGPDRIRSAQEPNSELENIQETWSTTSLLPRLEGMLGTPCHTKTMLVLARSDPIGINLCMVCMVFYGEWTFFAACNTSSLRKLRQL